MSTAPSLLIDLAGVARLARVQRPVVSTWRARFAATQDPFPNAVTDEIGRPCFNADEVADWLVRTEHGNNPDAREDAAAAATPAGFSFTDASAVAELEALIAMYAQTDSLSELTHAQLNDAAAEFDPSDRMFHREIAAHVGRGAPWLAYAARLVDAAYSPSAALALVARRHAASNRAIGSAGKLVAEVTALVVDATLALTGNDTTVVLDADDAALSLAIANKLGDEVSTVLPSDVEARRVRRQLLVEGHWVGDGADPATRSVVVARVPSNRGEDVAAILQAVDEVSLSLRPADAAVVIGPARALVDPLTPADELVRADILRSGHVRGIARLTTGLVDSAVRESLAMWMLGQPAGEVPPAQRATAVADLSDAQLTPATRADLVSDLMAAMGGRRDLRAHHFRFAKFVATSSLQASSGSLVASAKRGGRPSSANVRALPALLDMAGEAVRTDLTPFEVVPEPQDAQAAASVSELVAAGHLRRVQGTRLDPDLLGEKGLVVVTAADLDEPTSIGRTRVDQLTFATQHPSAQLTRPGDVVFRTSPTAAAWVDTDGSKVVAYPARVLRITPADSGGLVPELIAADIAVQAGGPGAWQRWMLRRVAPSASAPLRRALSESADVRAALMDRVARLDHYIDTLTTAVAAGTVTLTESDATASALK